MRKRHGFALVLLLVGCGGDDTPADTAEAAPEVVADAVDSTPEATAETERPPPACDDLGDPSLALTQEGTVLRDRDGRSVLLRGLNAGGRSKVPPFVPFSYDAVDEEAPPFDEALAVYLDRVHDWGLNVVRLVFTWEAVEPERGRYDEAFLQRLDAMVAAATERRVRVILDNHQDVFARPYCGDGFPLWAMADPDVDKPADCSTWFLGYFQNAAMQNDFDRFWNNEDGLMDAFEAMWTMMAQRYRDHDGVIGYEIINEPGWGTHRPETFGGEVLTPFYTRMISVIRAVTDSQLVVIDTTGIDGVLGETSLTRPEGEGLIFAPHFYDALALAGTKVPADLGIVHEKIAAWRALGDTFQLPTLIGEFGAAYDLAGAPEFIRAHWDAFDALQIHGTQWEYSVTGDVWNTEVLGVVDLDGTERATGRELLRPYPAAVAGSLTSFSYDSAAATADLSLEADGVTLIRAPARLYPNGPRVTIVEGEGCTRYDEMREELVIGARGSVRLTIAP